MSEPEYHNGEFYEVAAKGEKLVNEGHTVYFKWTCEACGERVSFSTPNELYFYGSHEDCPVDPGHNTDLRVVGINYMVLMTGNDVLRKEQRTN